MGILTNYKNKECKTWVGKMFQRLVFNTYYKIGFFLAIIIACAIGFHYVGDKPSIFDVLFAISLSFFVLLAVIALIFAWVINPIKSYLENKKGGY